MKNLIKTLEEKVEKHDKKLKLHISAKDVLEGEYLDFRKKNEIDSEKFTNVENKLLSTVKNIEYHKATSKTYKKVIALLNKKL